MNTRRKIEVFSAGCKLCEDTVELVKRIACESCDVTVMSMKDPETVKRAETIGIHSVPAVVIDGRLAGCCAGGGIDETALKAEGIGSPLG